MKKNKIFIDSHNSPFGKTTIVETERLKKYLFTANIINKDFSDSKELLLETAHKKKKDIQKYLKQTGRVYGEKAREITIYKVLNELVYNIEQQEEDQILLKMSLLEKWPCNKNGEKVSRLKLYSTYRSFIIHNYTNYCIQKEEQNILVEIDEIIEQTQKKYSVISEKQILNLFKKMFKPTLQAYLSAEMIQQKYAVFLIKRPALPKKLTMDQRYELARKTRLIETINHVYQLNQPNSQYSQYIEQFNANKIKK